ncbi:MAG: hypothetical protein AAF363_09370 [Bacteroidota bacterium]
MNNSSQLTKLHLTFGLIASLFGALFYIGSNFIGQNPSLLSLGITVDVAFLIPLIYFLLIRKTDVPNVTVVPIFFLGLFLAGNVIPVDHQGLLENIRNWMIPVVELAVLSIVAYKAINLRKSFKENGLETLDFYDRIKSASGEILPSKISNFFAMETATFYYGFFSWKKRTTRDNEFTYHKESGVVYVLSTIIFMVVAETLILHLVIQLWSQTVAVILTILSIYTGLQLFGMTRSLFFRPIQLNEDDLKLKFGIMAEAIIPISEIESIEQTSRDFQDDEQIRNLSPFGELGGSYNFILHLKNERILHSLYGMKKSFKSIAFHIDDRLKFESQIQSKMKLLRCS